MKFIYNDGGRAAAGYKGHAGDCVCRAVTIASGGSYQWVYDTLHELTKREGETGRGRVARKIKKGGGRRGTTPRNGVFKKVYHNWLLSIGFKWVPTMKIGGGCQVHLRENELPAGRLIVRVSKHLCAVIDGVLMDTYDCSREGTRCVYGYYIFQPQTSKQ